MVCLGFVARPCALALEQESTDDGRQNSYDVRHSRIHRGRQVVEHKIQVGSQNEAWIVAATYFGCDTPYSECDRYTVDTYWF